MKIEPSYQQALDYLYTFVDYSLTHSFPTPDHFDLDRISDFLAYLGNPHHTYPIIHVTGTKGKGSVSAMCARVLEAAGYCTGLYTSPHLSDYAERIQVNGKPIPHDELVALVDEVRPYLDKGTLLTTFEISTALAFLYYARQGATAVVAEVGLGGRLDATNVVLPIVSVITSISYDHMAVLGNTLDLIAKEKAGIIKPGVPVVISPQQEEARAAIQAVAEELGSPLTQVGKDLLYTIGEHSLEGQTVVLWSSDEAEQWEAYRQGAQSNGWQPRRIQVSLLGEHQAENAATAYAALQVAVKQGLEIPEAAFQDGMANVVWPGRFEILQDDPPVVVDSAHNRHSALKLRRTLDEYYPGRSLLLVFGASMGKDITGMFEELIPRADSIITTRSYHPRSMSPEKLAELARPYGRPVRAIEKIEDAFEQALHQVPPDGVVLVTGSVFIVGGARDTWYNFLEASN